MSNLWWLDSDWKQARCSRCGMNIWDSGGDPDWGLCYDCFSYEMQMQQEYEHEPEPYPEQELTSG